MGFTLKDVDPVHPYVRHRGIAEETARTFGVGHFAGKGTMNGRVVIPIHNVQGELVAYAGRWPGDDVPEGEGKYKLPANFKKMQELYNVHRALKSGEGKAIVVVEGFFDAIKIHQAGVPNVVALMGISLSDVQREILTTHFDRVVLMLDGDDAGRKASAEIGARLADAQLDVYAVMLATGEQPDRLSSEQIRTLLNFLL